MNVTLRDVWGLFLQSVGTALLLTVIVLVAIN